MDGKVKVADFGIARAVSSQTMNAATVVGSVHYISRSRRGADTAMSGVICILSVSRCSRWSPVMSRLQETTP